MFLTMELEEEFVVGPFEGASERKWCGGRYLSTVVMGRRAEFVGTLESLWC